jgi:hypothetical protein
VPPRRYQLYPVGRTVPVDRDQSIFQLVSVVRVNVIFVGAFGIPYTVEFDSVRLAVVFVVFESYTEI